MSKRLAIALAVGLGLLIIAATIIMVVTVNGMTAATLEADYRACLDAGGLHDTNSTKDMAAIAERCYSAVYGE